MEIEVNHLWKQYGKVTILKDINLKFNPGIYGLLGPNGAGKTTLLNILADVSTLSKGEVIWNGKDIKINAKEYKNILGFLPQDVGFYPTFKVKDFLLYMAELKEINKKVANKRIEEIVKRVNIEKYFNVKCLKLSGGTKRRLGLAACLLNDPKVLILDEPTAGLDPQERINFRQLISGFAKDKIVIISTHIVSDIDRIANNIVLLENGQVIAQGSVKDIIREMEGKVWQTEAVEADLEKIRSSCKVVNYRLLDSGKYSIRIISMTPPMINSSLVNPNIEDVYSGYFRNPYSEVK